MKLASLLNWLQEKQALPLNRLQEKRALPLNWLFLSGI